MQKFRKRPIVVEALQWHGDKDHRPMYDFLTGSTDQPIETRGLNYLIDHERVKHGLVIRTLEGDMAVDVGDWVIKGIKGEFYPCKPDIFAKLYDLVD